MGHRKAQDFSGLDSKAQGFGEVDGRKVESCGVWKRKRLLVEETGGILSWGGGDAQEASESGSQGGGWEEGRAGAQSLQGLGGPGEELGLFSPWNLQMLEP